MISFLGWIGFSIVLIMLVSMQRVVRFGILDFLCLKVYVIFLCLCLILDGDVAVTMVKRVPKI